MAQIETDAIEACIEAYDTNDESPQYRYAERESARTQLAALVAKIAELRGRQSHLRHLLTLWAAEAGRTDDSVLASMTRKELANNGD